MFSLFLTPQGGVVLPFFPFFLPAMRVFAAVRQHYIPVLRLQSKGAKTRKKKKVMNRQNVVIPFTIGF